jgi:hypothetical protein
MGDDVGMFVICAGIKKSFTAWQWVYAKRADR